MRTAWAALGSAVALVSMIASAYAKAPEDHWVASWATALQASEPANMLTSEQMSHATLRQFVRLSVGGKAFRLVLSNTFGSEPLHLKAVHTAKAGPKGTIDPASDRSLTFSGKHDVTLPPGSSYISDPVAMPLGPLADLAISILYDAAPGIQTGHPSSRTTSYVVAGDHLGDAQLAGALAVDHWYQIASVEVLAPLPTTAIVTLGDSIADGRGSTTNGNDRWTNIMAAQNKGRAVLNAGIGGNCVLKFCLGPSALTRFDRDVLTPPGVATLIISEGVNDLGGLTREHPATPEEHAALVSQLIEAYTQMATQAKAHGIKTYIATVLPFTGNAYYHPDVSNEADRASLNGWIRTQKIADGVIDFDAVVRDPAHPEKLNPAYDTGDGLHLNPAGYRVMGNTAAKVISPGHKPGKGKKK